MDVGTILLTSHNVYVKDNGELPRRPIHDKELLKGICEAGSVSPEGLAMLPPSIQAVCKVKDFYDVAVSIKELACVDLLIVSRSNEWCDGKKFRLDKFKCLVKDRHIEIWVKDIT